MDDPIKRPRQRAAVNRRPCGADARHMDDRDGLRISQDAAIVLGLAETSVPFAVSREDEAERWVRVMRMHGQVGSVLQSLGVGEAALESPSQPPALRRGGRSEAVSAVRERACQLAVARGGGVVSTPDVLFAVEDVYGGAFNRALYVRGATWDEVVESLRSHSGVAS